MAARNKPAGIRSLVYGMGKGKAGIEGLSVSLASPILEIMPTTYTRHMTSQVWLITGGAGYIGAHVADTFLSSGKEVIIYDSLSRGLESRIQFLRKKHKKEITLIAADIRDTTKFDDVLSTHNPYGIVHTAALKSVAESMEKPDEYFEVNFHATTALLALVKKHKIQHFIFSSTAAVYGAPEHSIPVKENDPKNPISAYGASKLAAEGSVNNFLNSPGNHGTSLRFFNVVGTSDSELIDNSVENLVPIVINKLNAGRPPIIYGTDYPTQDGTCVRDYVDVRDIAQAHLAVADFPAKLPFAMNVGTGGGNSVREVIKLVCDASGESTVVPLGENPRKGDPAFLCADVSLIRNAIGFSASHSLEGSIKSLFGD
jgi:UDP-glucose 4-epimerase